MDSQKHQVEPACGQIHPFVTQDRPCTVGVVENPHDPTSYILYVQSKCLVTILPRNLFVLQNIYVVLFVIWLHYSNPIIFFFPGFGAELS